jgi:hypothetical protein
VNQNVRFWDGLARNIREADVSSLEISDHGAHLVPLPRPVVALERRAAIRIHQHTLYSLISTGVSPRMWYTASAREQVLEHIQKPPCHVPRQTQHVKVIPA